MTNLFPIQLQQEHPIFGRFNARYGDLLAEHCPPLQEFQIKVLTSDAFLRNPGELPMIDLDENDAFACSSDKQEDAISSTKAGIIFNKAAIDRLGLTEEEQFAAIAHEIGHIIYRFSSLKDKYPGHQGQEVFADTVACEIGLTTQIRSLVSKMMSSGLYAEAESRFGMRKLLLDSMCL